MQQNRGEIHKYNSDNDLIELSKFRFRPDSKVFRKHEVFGMLKTSFEKHLVDVEIHR